MLGWHALAIVACGLWGTQGGWLTNAAAVLFTAGAAAVLRRGLLAGAWRPEPRHDRARWRRPPHARLARAWRLRPGSVIRSAYLAAERLEQPLLTELNRKGVAIEAWHGRLALSPDQAVESWWALDVWTDCAEHAAPSVKAAADTLRGMQRNWSSYAAAHHRRMALIQDRLPAGQSPPARLPRAGPALPPRRLDAAGPRSPARQPGQDQPFPQWASAASPRTAPAPRAGPISN